ncbi:hypothetical protein D3C87_538970 [compost metagenome]
MNKLEIAADSFTEAHPKNNRIGLKIIPPPIPSIPDNNPMAKPIVKANGKLIFTSSFSLKLNTPNNLNAAKTNTIPKTIL